MIQQSESEFEDPGTVMRARGGRAGRQGRTDAGGDVGRGVVTMTGGMTYCVLGRREGDLWRRGRGRGCRWRRGRGRGCPAVSSSGDTASLAGLDNGLTCMQCHDLQLTLGGRQRGPAPGVGEEVLLRQLVSEVLALLDDAGHRVHSILVLRQHRSCLKGPPQTATLPNIAACTNILGP